MARQMVPTAVASALTGLSTEKLREWTIRRALIPADVRSQGKGSSAQFTWQTILVLRLAVVLKDRFHIELQAHKPAFDGLLAEIRRNAFPSLWGCKAVLDVNEHWSILALKETGTVDSIALGLDPHLEIIRDGFAFRGAMSAPEQGDLFALPSVYGQPKIGRGPGLAELRSSRP